MLPHDESIQHELLTLLNGAPKGAMHCQDIYRELATRFPELSEDEVSVPYRRSVSHWANRVQFARLHLIQRGRLLPAHATSRGVWALSPDGKKYLAEAKTADELLEELLQA